MDRSGSNNPGWKGGTTVRPSGYRLVLDHSHPRANYDGYVREHIVIAEKAFGGPLPEQAVVHHVDENRSNNANSNLVICENQGFHRVLHRRMSALKACGHPDWMKCWICKRYDDPSNMMKSSNISHSRVHRSCKSANQRIARENRKNALS